MTMNLSRREFGIRMAALAGAATWGASRPVFAQSSPKEVRIGWQKGSAIQILARQERILERRLEKLGVNSVGWVEFQFGPPMLEALGAGAIDFGSVGDTPPIFAQAGGTNLVYAASSPSAPHGVLVPKDSPITSLAQLKGRKVAFGKGSSAHNVTLKALALAGLSIKDIVPVYLAPADATAAFIGGSVDAWVVWDPYYAIAEQRYGARAIADTTDKRLTSASYYMAGRDFATRYPNALAAVVDEFTQLTVKAGRNRDALAAVAAQSTGIDAKIWSIAFNRSEFTMGPVTDAQVLQQQQLADTFHALGIIPRKINVRDIVWRAPGVCAGG